MSYTTPNLVGYNFKAGTAVALQTAAITTTGALTPFYLPYPSGVYFGQLIIQCVLGSVTTLTADLEVDLTQTDANFTAIIAGTNYFASPIGGPYNFPGGNIRYRLNVKSFTDGGSSGVLFYAIAG